MPPPFTPFQPVDASYLQHAPTPVSPYNRVMRKVKEEPVVFGFLGLTVGALMGGLRAMGRADARQSQLWMRARVFFQFCTVSALVGSIYVRAVSACAAAVTPFGVFRVVAGGPHGSVGSCAYLPPHRQRTLSAPRLLPHPRRLV